MSEATTVTTPEAPTPVVPKAKKATKPAEKKSPTKAEKSTGLRKPQERILKALSRNKNPLTRAQLAEKAPVDVAACVEYVGSTDPQTRAANDKKHFPSLITLGLVKHAAPSDDGGGVSYEITAKGKTMAAKL